MTARQIEVLAAAAMQERDDEGLGAFARRLPWGSYGLLARASLTRAGPRRGAQALVPAPRPAGRRDPAGGHRRRQQRVDHAGGVAPAAAEVRELSIAFILRNVHGLACWYVDSRIPLLEARFPFAAPPHADAYPHMFPGGPLQFGAAAWPRSASMPNTCGCRCGATRRR
jgi:hypothetical protein